MQFKNYYKLQNNYPRSKYYTIQIFIITIKNIRIINYISHLLLNFSLILERSPPLAIKLTNALNLFFFTSVSLFVS